jgi:hypothetical protein
MAERRDSSCYSSTRIGRCALADRRRGLQRNRCRSCSQHRCHRPGYRPLSWGRHHIRRRDRSVARRHQTRSSGCRKPCRQSRHRSRLSHRCNRTRRREGCVQHWQRGNTLGHRYHSPCFRRPGRIRSFQEQPPSKGRHSSTRPRQPLELPDNHCQHCTVHSSARPFPGCLPAGIRQAQRPTMGNHRRCGTRHRYGRPGPPYPPSQ